MKGESLEVQCSGCGFFNTVFIARKYARHVKGIICSDCIIKRGIIAFDKAWHKITKINLLRKKVEERIKKRKKR